MAKKLLTLSVLGNVSWKTVSSQIMLINLFPIQEQLDKWERHTLKMLQCFYISENDSIVISLDTKRISSKLNLLFYYLNEYSNRISIGNYPSSTKKGSISFGNFMTGANIPVKI